MKSDYLTLIAQQARPGIPVGDGSRERPVLRCTAKRDRASIGSQPDEIGEDQKLLLNERMNVEYRADRDLLPCFRVFRIHDVSSTS